MAIVLNAGIIC